MRVQGEHSRLACCRDDAMSLLFSRPLLLLTCIIYIAPRPPGDSTYSHTFSPHDQRRHLTKHSHSSKPALPNDVDAHPPPLLLPRRQQPPRQSHPSPQQHQRNDGGSSSSAGRGRGGGGHGVSNSEPRGWEGSSSRVRGARADVVFLGARAHALTPPLTPPVHTPTHINPQTGWPRRRPRRSSPTSPSCRSLASAQVR